jgi:hypothetical protein
MNGKPHKVPRPFQVQLARLFGENSREARAEFRSAAQWRETLKHTLRELDRYQKANIHTDELHNVILASGLFAAEHALKSEDFWPGYVEGLIRFALCLMGDYPDHRKRKSGKRRVDHYDLTKRRTPIFVQNAEQQFHALFAASAMKLLRLPTPLSQITEEFYRAYGYTRSKVKFMNWFKRTYPEAYTSIF